MQTKAKKKLQGELDDVTVEREKERSSASAMAHKQKKFDQQLAEERAAKEALAAERDNAEKQARAMETKLLSLNNELSDMEDRLAEVSLEPVKECVFS